MTGDVRGHGASKPIGEEFSVVSVAEDLRALIDHLDHETVKLMGALVRGACLPRTYISVPGAVDALVVIGATDITTLPSRLERVGLKLSPYVFKVWPDGHLRKLVAENTAVTSEVQQYAGEASHQLSKKEFVTVWKAIALFEAMLYSLVVSSLFSFTLPVMKQ
nr:alpha/beta hydrolase [Haladaptatus salinisoli]